MIIPFRLRALGVAMLAASINSGCGQQEAEAPPAVIADPVEAEAEAKAPAPAGNPLRNAYYGDLHVHTALSVDAFITNTRTLPDDAYRYAKGEEIDHVSGNRIRIGTPLDFMAVTDHSEVLGMARAMGNPDNPLSREPLAAGITSLDYDVSQNTFRGLVTQHSNQDVNDLTRIAMSEGAQQASADAWQLLRDAAESHYEPGKFTTFVAYEWSSQPDFANLHRNVVFRGTNVPPTPFSSLNSANPEDLWAHLDEWRSQGGDDAIAIPHNSNASKGRMYPLLDSFGNELNADYAERRLRNEPITEMTQFKGTSETHPELSANDEFAEFEIWNTTVGAPVTIEPDVGGYVRHAFQRGLLLEEQKGFNPYRFGLIGSSDTHNSSSAVEENNFTGGHGNADSTAEKRLNSKESTLALASTNFSASGLAGVWAESNTRDAIFDAMRRRETFATSGPRISVRFFAGADYADGTLDSPDALEQAYAGGVPMGGVLQAGSGSPDFLVWANMDPVGQRLQRVQIVKAWVEQGETRERIFDVACSDGGTPDAETARCPDNGASVNLADCSVSEQGAASLSAQWRDPAYDPARRAVYYARVIENPSCRWSSWDAVRLGQPAPQGVAATLQERAWSSPIWVQPAP
jgi:hypothetical protein